MRTIRIADLPGEAQSYLLSEGSVEGPFEDWDMLVQFPSKAVLLSEPELPAIAEPEPEKLSAGGSAVRRKGENREAK
jgi:hypothetical protein